jgi:branched-chain amino acid transport system substrate-binding protein
MFRPLCRVLSLIMLLSASVAGAGEVRIGLANTFSGPYAASGERVRTVVQLAVETLNQAGGVLGQQVKLIAVDDACGTDQAAAAALALIKAGVDFVVGHRCSHSSLTAAPIYEAAGIPMMTIDSTHPMLTEEGRPNVFRLIGRDDAQGRIAGDWLAAQQPRRPIGIVHDQSTYGKGLALRTRARLRELGVQEALLATYSPGAADYRELIQRLRQAGVGLLYIGGYGPDAGRIACNARESGSDLQIVGGDGLGMEEFWTIAGPAGEGAVFTTRVDVRALPEAAPVLQAFEAMGLGSLPTGVDAYAAVQIWAEAATRAGSTDPVKITEALHRSRFATALGRVAFDQKGDLSGAAWQWQVWHVGSYAPLRASEASN